MKFSISFITVLALTASLAKSTNITSTYAQLYSTESSSTKYNASYNSKTVCEDDKPQGWVTISRQHSNNCRGGNDIFYKNLLTIVELSTYKVGATLNVCACHNFIPSNWTKMSESANESCKSTTSPAAVDGCGKSINIRKASEDK